MPWTHTQVSVGTGSGTLLAANSERSFARFQNNHATAVVHISLDGGTATATRGVRLNAAGGAYEMSGALGNLENGLITAISDTATTGVLVSEKTH